MTKNEAMQKYNEEYQKALKTEIFPQDQLPDGFDKWKHAAFQFESVTGFVSKYGLSWMDYKLLMMKNANFTLFEVAIVCNAIEARTPFEITQFLGEYNYYNVQDKVHGVNVAWEKIAQPLRESIQRKIEIMSAPNGQYNTKPLTFIKS